MSENVLCLAEQQGLSLALSVQVREGSSPSKLAGATITAPLVNSSSTVTRVATHFAIGSVAEVSSGMGTRFVGGMLTSGGDFKGAGMQAINPQNILFDAALGGTMRSFNGIQKPQQQSFADMMSPTDAEKHDKSFGCRGENGSYSVENQVQNNKDFFRPSWRQSELDAAQDFPDYQAQMQKCSVLSVQAEHNYMVT